MKIKKGFYLILGFISLALGAIGAILPILPTTPFLLLSAFCFTQSSECLHNWFIQTKLYQNNLKTLVKGQGMTKKAKIRVVSMVTLTMLLGFILMGGTVIGRVILVIVWICHLLYFILGVKTIAAETPFSDTN
ncbi:YbaN family protein [Acetobacterium sp. K1/6]|uniref:YbaN family protein n=1 Tax=Acetobacterium sp. K1/6 TaxID=3055467 RepID=UPI002ACA6AFE|nr:YbaN family protein [Acetobacterium sp. K1/6]MDZ5725792.1 YbaN family protein [Acetobacterium sp. K1/6]